MSKPALWTKDFIIVSTLNFLLVLVFYLLVVVMGLYATEELGASPAQAGLAVGMFVIGVLAGRLIVGQYLDRLGRRPTMFFGLFLSVVTCLGYFATSGIDLLIINRFFHGLSIGIAATALGTVVAFIIPISRRGEGIGYYSMSSTLATAIGPFIGLWMTQHTSFQWVLVLCTIVAVVSFLVGFLLTVPEVPHDERKTIPKAFSVKRLIAAEVAPLCSIIFFLGTFYSGVLSFLNAYAVQLDLVASASFFFIAYSIAVLASRPVTGRLLDSYGPNLVMYPAFIIMIAGFATLGTADVSWKILLAGALIGLGFGNLQSSTQALAIKIVDQKRIGLATATFFIFLDAGLGFGPYILGYVVVWTGYANLFLLMSGLICFCLLAYYWVHGRQPYTGHYHERGN